MLKDAFWGSVLAAGVLAVPGRPAQAFFGGKDDDIKVGPSVNESISSP
jgi:hypothetical protein